MTNDSNNPANAFVTVTDAAGRVLFRRLATPREIAEARALAAEADASAHAALDELADRRALFASANAPPQFAAPEPPPRMATAAGDAQLEALDDFEPEAAPEPMELPPQDVTKSHRWWVDSAAPEEPPLFEPAEMDALGIRRTVADRD